MKGKKKRCKIVQRSIPLWLLLLILGSMGGAMALVISTLPSEKVSLFSGGVEASNFIVSDLDTKLKGKNKVDVKVTVENTDTSGHAADVTVQLLDGNGDIINIGGSDMESTQSTGTVAGGDSMQLTFTFAGTDLVSQYNSALVIIEQTS